MKRVKALQRCSNLDGVRIVQFSGDHIPTDISSHALASHLPSVMPPPINWGRYSQSTLSSSQICGRWVVCRTASTRRKNSLKVPLSWCDLDLTQHSEFWGGRNYLVCVEPSMTGSFALVQKDSERILDRVSVKRVSVGIYTCGCVKDHAFKHNIFSELVYQLPSAEVVYGHYPNGRMWIKFNLQKYGWVRGVADRIRRRHHTLASCITQCEMTDGRRFFVGYDFRFGRFRRVEHGNWKMSDHVDVHSGEGSFVFPPSPPLPGLRWNFETGNGGNSGSRDPTGFEGTRPPTRGMESQSFQDSQFSASGVSSSPSESPVSPELSGDDAVARKPERKLKRRKQLADESPYAAAAETLQGPHSQVTEPEMFGKHPLHKEEEMEIKRGDTEEDEKDGQITMVVRPGDAFVEKVTQVHQIIEGDPRCREMEFVPTPLTGLYGTLVGCERFGGKGLTGRWFKKHHPQVSEGEKPMMFDKLIEVFNEGQHFPMTISFSVSSKRLLLTERGHLLLIGEPLEGEDQLEEWRTEIEEKGNFAYKWSNAEFSGIRNRMNILIGTFQNLQDGYQEDQAITDSLARARAVLGPSEQCQITVSAENVYFVRYRLGWPVILDRRSPDNHWYPFTSVEDGSQIAECFDHPDSLPSLTNLE